MHEQAAHIQSLIHENIRLNIKLLLKLQKRSRPEMKEAKRKMMEVLGTSFSNFLIINPTLPSLTFLFFSN